MKRTGAISLQLALENTPHGVRLRVQAQPRARSDALLGEHDGRLKVAVSQPPERGRANAAIVRILAESLRLKRTQVELTAGAASSQKTFLVTGLEMEELRRRIETALGDRDDS